LAVSFEGAAAGDYRGCSTGRTMKRCWCAGACGQVVAEGVRKHEKEEWEKRYRMIREFENIMGDGGTRVVKFFCTFRKRSSGSGSLRAERSDETLEAGAGGF